MIKIRLLTLGLFTLPLISLAQENSPYSRYGIGNLVPSGNILNRGMGGISAGFSDPTVVNFMNPASYGNLIYTTLDLGLSVDTRTIRSTSPQAKFNSANAMISYLNVGFPLLGGNKKAIKNRTGWGVNFGLRPISKIDYKIERSNRTTIDSMYTLFEGTGGTNEAYIGTGIRTKNFSIGFNTGYLFGNKNYSTRLSFINDTVRYQQSNSSIKTSFGGVFLNGGMQYSIFFDSSSKSTGSVMRLGVYGNLNGQYNGSQDILRETYVYDANSGDALRLDSVYEKNEVKGKVQMPATIGGGFTYENEHLLFGLDFEMTNWNKYSFYGQKDFVKNSWIVKGGIQYLPLLRGSNRYWNYVKYRAGFYVGPDYINVNSKLPQYGITLGGSFPLKLKKSYYETQYSTLHLALEYGNRGNNNNSIRENIFRISAGFSLSDIWFRRYKYD